MTFCTGHMGNTFGFAGGVDAVERVFGDTISGYIGGLLDGVEFKQTSYALDHGTRKATLARFLKKMCSPPDDGLVPEEHLAA